MALSKKQMLLLGGVSVAALGAYMLFRKPRIEYFDDIWCSEGCQNIEDEFGGIQGYIEHMEACCMEASEGEVSKSGGTGNVNLLFRKPHGLSVGDEIYLKQNEVKRVFDYDGTTTVRRVINENIVSLNMARIGSSNVVGGEVIKPSLWSEISPF